MSDLMLFGVLRMPFELAMGDEMSRRQFYDRVQEATDRMEKAEAAFAERQLAPVASAGAPAELAPTLCIAPDVLASLLAYNEDDDGGPLPRGFVYPLHADKLAMGYVTLFTGAGTTTVPGGPGSVATLPKNPEYAGQKNWTLHRCADGNECLAAIDGGCAEGMCAHFGVRPDDQGVPRFPKPTPSGISPPPPVPAAGESDHG